MKSEKNAYNFRKLNNTNIQNTNTFSNFLKLYALKKTKMHAKQKNICPLPSPQRGGSCGASSLAARGWKAYRE